MKITFRKIKITKSIDGKKELLDFMDKYKEQAEKLTIDADELWAIIYRKIKSLK